MKKPNKKILIIIIIIISIVAALSLICVIASILGLGAMLGLFSDPVQTRSFAAIKELKASADNGTLLFPDLPKGFEPPPYTRTLEGYYYKRTDTWDYYIELISNKQFTLSSDPERHRRIGEGEYILDYALFCAFEPKHKDDNRRVPNRRIETRKYGEALDNPKEGTLRIEGVPILRGSNFSVFPEREDKSGKRLPAYTSVTENAAFRYKDVLYTLEIKIAGHGGETEDKMLKVCNAMMDNLIAEMIRSGTVAQ